MSASMLKVAEVAEMLGVTPQQVYAYAKEGQLAYIRMGVEKRAAMRILRRDVEAFLARGYVGGKLDGPILEPATAAA
jgi:excisionase family DNA binding protein